MRFHHSTRRGRTRVNQHNLRQQAARSGSGSRWSQLGYCRESNIHFNRRLPVEPPPAPSQAADGADSSRSAHHKRQKGRAAARSQQASFEQSSPETAAAHDRLISQQQLQQQQIDQQLHRLTLNMGPQDEEDSEDQAAAAADPTIVTCSPLPMITDPPKLDMESAREKLVAQVEKHPFWSNKAARRMRLTSLDERRVYVYELISFCERRDLEWRYEPYKGGLGASIPYRRRPFTLAGTEQSSFSASQPASPSTPQTILPPSPPPSASPSPASRHIRNRPLRLGGSGGSSQDRPTSGGYRSASCDEDSKRPLEQPESGLPSTAASSISQLQAQQQQVWQATSGRVRRSLTDARSLYEPVSALERPMPSQELVWSIEPPPQLRPDPFAGQVHSSEFPNSSFVKRCHGCQGRGRIKCNSCYGVGYEVCISCSGKGTTRQSALGSSLSGANHSSGQSRDQSRNSSHANGDSALHGHDGHSSGGAGSRGAPFKRGHEPGGITQHSGGSGWSSECCHFCHGAGQKRCWVCAGRSYNHCLGCLGSGQLRCFLRLNITWLNHRDESVLNNSDNIIPRERLRLSSGLTLVDELGDRLRPLARSRLDGATNVGAGTGTTSTTTTTSTSPQESAPSQLHSVSKRLLERHQQNYRQERLIKQRHKVTQIECHIVKYEWKQRRGHFVIYGQERKVYIAKYPFKSICSIS